MSGNHWHLFDALHFKRQFRVVSCPPPNSSRRSIACYLDKGLSKVSHHSLTICKAFSNEVLQLCNAAFVLFCNWVIIRYGACNIQKLRLIWTASQLTEEVNQVVETGGTPEEESQWAAIRLRGKDETSDLTSTGVNSLFSDKAFMIYI